MLLQAALAVVLLLFSRPISCRPPHHPSSQQDVQIPSCRGASLERCRLEHIWAGSTPWECVDVRTAVKNCGGCMQPMFEHGAPPGQDCTIIPGQMDVACVSGRCQVQSCLPDWRLSKDKASCTEDFDEGD